MTQIMKGDVDEGKDIKNTKIKHATYISPQCCIEFWHGVHSFVEGA